MWKYFTTDAYSIIYINSFIDTPYFFTTNPLLTNPNLMKKIFRFLQIMVLVMLWGGAMAQAPYCTPTYTTGCTFGDGLTLFQLGTINQAIACNGAPNAWYHDYTASSTDRKSTRLNSSH